MGRHYRSDTGQAKVRNLVLSAIVLLAMAACGGGGASDPALEEPLAAALVVGQSEEQLNVTVRSGAEVVLNGENSDGTRFPLDTAEWRQTDSTGITVELAKRTETTRAFRVPQVDEPVTLTFELTVTNQDGEASTREVRVSVIPVDDADRFLEFFRQIAGHYTVVVALRPDTVTTSPVSFTVTERQLVDYADRTTGNNGAQNQFGIAIGSTKTKSSSILADVTADWSTESEALDAYYHPNLIFPVPRLDTDDINLQFDDVDPDRGVADHRRDSVTQYVDLTLEITGGSCETAAGDPIDCADATQLFVLKTNGEIANTTSEPANQTVSVDDLKAFGDPHLRLGGSAAQPESGLSAAAYYEAVDPNDARLTFSDWLENAGFTSGGEFVDDGRTKRTLYINNYDLGFTRSMFIRTNADGDVFAYVTNYPALRKALLDSDSIATVAMEYGYAEESPDHSMPMPSERFVKFFVFIDDGTGEQRRVSSLNFDGRGEKWVPGACVPCHGGVLPEITGGIYPEYGNIDAAFLPWDLDSLLYVDAEDPALVDPLVVAGFELNPQYITPEDLAEFSLENQQDDFRAQNEAALVTMPPGPRFNLVRRQIHEWYGSTDFDSNTLPDNPYNGFAHIPEDWPEEYEDVYHEVFARHCRICHSQTVEINPLDTFRALEAKRDEIERFVYEDGLMPNARLDMDRFWVEFRGGETPATRLATALGFDTSDPDSKFVRGPGRPVARIRGRDIQTAFPVYDEDSTDVIRDNIRNLGGIRLDASLSAFAEEYAWRLVYPRDDSIQITGANTARPGLMIERPGNYVFRLYVGNGKQPLPEESVLNADTPDPSNPQADPCSTNDQCAVVQVIAESFLPMESSAASFAMTVQKSNTVAFPSFVIDRSILEFIDEDSDSDQLQYLIETGPDHGTLVPTTFTQADINAGSVSYRLDSSTVSMTDRVTFRVVDQYGAEALGQLDISIDPADPLPPEGPMCPTVVDLTVNSFMDPSESRNGDNRDAGDDADIPWIEASIAGVLTGACSDADTDFDDLVFTVTDTPSAPSGVLDGSPLAGDNSFLGSEAGSVGYRNQAFTQGDRDFTIEVSDGVLTDTFILRVEQRFHFEHDMGWVIDTEWRNADALGLNSCTTADFDGPRSCAQCHFIDDDATGPNSGCGTFVWTDLRMVPSTMPRTFNGGNLNCANLQTEVTQGDLPDFPTGGLHLGGVIFDSGSNPHELLSWWSIQSPTVQCQGNEDDTP